MTHFLHLLRAIPLHIEQFALLFAYSVWEYWLGKTEKLVAASTWELIFYGLRRLKERIVMLWKKT